MTRDELPQDWRMLRLGDPSVCADMQPGFACGKKDTAGGVPHLRMNNIRSDGNPDYSLVRRIPPDVANGTSKWLEPHDVLFCNTNSTELVGKSCVFRGWQERCTFSNHLTRIRPNARRLTSDWLLLALRHLWVKGFFATHCQEFIGQSAFKLDKLREVEIPVPPLREQRRIVVRTRALIGRQEEARRLHAEAMSQVSRLFQAGLEGAFAPHSTEDWPTYGTEQLFSVVRGQVDPREEPYTNMPHVGPDSIESGTGRLLRETIRTPRQLGLKSGKYLFGPQHVLYSKIRPALRKVCLPDFAGVCSADMYALAPNRELISREFLALSLLSPGFSQYAVDNSDRNAMPKINRKVLSAYEMPVPDKATQEGVVKDLLGLRKKADLLVAFQSELDSELAAFTPALLAKAFRGEL